MPEFKMTGKDSPEFAALDDFTQAYIEAAFFTEEERLTEEMGEERPAVLINAGTLESRFYKDSVPSFEMLAPETLAAMIADCAKFQTDNDLTIRQALHKGQGTIRLMDNDHARAGADFWFTRNGHGCGFWDGDWPEPYATELDNAAKTFGEVYLHVGDDGLIYTS